MTTTTGMFHLLPEIGWMYSDNFALAVQARVEFIKQQQGTWKDPGDPSNKFQLISGSWMSGAPTNMAFAALGRAIFYTDLSDSGNFQLSYSGDVGGGFIRFPVVPSVITSKDDMYIDSNGNYQPRHDRAVAKTDTRPVGPFLVGASAGFIYHLSRHFAISLDGRFITGLPKFGAVLEGGLSAQLAFGGGKGPVQTEEEGEGDAGGGPLNDAPPTSDSSSEEEE